MKKFYSVFACGMVLCGGAQAAVSIKKAAPVATQQTNKIESAASLVPTVLSLAAEVKSLTQQQRALDAECVPTSTEINWVNNMMQEWAKTGAKTAAEAQTALGMSPCPDGITYAGMVETAAMVDGTDFCYDRFTGTEAVWKEYPKASIGYYCADGSMLAGCSAKNKKTVSNIYEVFNLIDFEPVDYTASEATMAAKLLDKIENCSPARLNAKKRAAWSEFLTQTISGVGQKTNTGTVMQTVQSLTNSGGLGGLGSLGSVASQFLDK